MLSEETTLRLKMLSTQQAAYRPKYAVQQSLAQKTLIMLIGATGMGKSSIMHGLNSQNPNISIVGTITSRPIRNDDDIRRYTFYEHSDDGLKPLIETMENGDLVQYAINPFNGFVYGSSPQDYPGEISIGDYYSSVVDDFTQYGFKKIIPISVITEPDSWASRFNTRFPSGHPDREARRQEAESSLVWSISRDDTHWVINRDGRLQTAIDTAQDIINGNVHPKNQAEAAILAVNCLETIRSLGT